MAEINHQVDAALQALFCANYGETCHSVEIPLVRSRRGTKHLAIILSAVAAATVLEMETKSGRDIRHFKRSQSEAHRKNAHDTSRITDHLRQVRKVIRKDKGWKRLCCNPPEPAVTTNSSSNPTSWHAAPCNSQASEPGPSQLTLTPLRDSFTSARRTVPLYINASLSGSTLGISKLSLDSEKDGHQEKP